VQSPQHRTRNHDENSSEEDEEPEVVVRATPSDMMSPEMCRKTPEVFKGLSNILNQQESVPKFKRNNYIRESDQELVTTMKSIK
jgi:hypothetical protein